MPALHRFRLVFVCQLAACLCTAGPLAAGEESRPDCFEPLFDGETLDAFIQHGGRARYRVEDGEIVGTTVPKTPNSFLCTKKTYGDFILELDFKVASNINSGVQIRSEVFDVPKTVEWTTEDGKTKTRKIPAGRVHGYQVEIDPSDRAWSAGIYDEARRGWLNTLKDNPKARKAFKPNEWNHYRIECRGDSIKTWINGVPAADLTDSMTSRGFIALQVHGVGGNEEKVGKEVRWRNLWIRELD